VREVRTLVELGVATGAMDRQLADAFQDEHQSFFTRFLERRLPGVESRMVYPTYRVGDTLNQQVDKFVFAHTHQPLCDVRRRDAGGRTLRFWNTGSWIYEPSLGSV
jgi:hypothetical protein